MNNPSWAVLFFVAGVLIIVFTLGRVMRRRRDRNAGLRDQNADPRDQNANLRKERTKDFRDWRGTDTDVSFDRHADAVLSERQLVEELEHHLENRIHTLKTLIREADGRIEMLSHLSERPGLSMRERVKELAADGLSLREIAEAAGLGAAEVRLALHLGEGDIDREVSDEQGAPPGEGPDEAEG